MPYVITETIENNEFLKCFKKFNITATEQDIDEFVDIDNESPHDIKRSKPVFFEEQQLVNEDENFCFFGKKHQFQTLPFATLNVFLISDEDEPFISDEDEPMDVDTITKLYKLTKPSLQVDKFTQSLQFQKDSCLKQNEDFSSMPI